MQKIALSYIILMLAFAQGLYAQGVKGKIAISNEKAIGSDYYFDLYLTADPSSTGDIYLADADFRISFDNTLFTSPSFHKRDSTVTVSIFNFSIGYCSFVPTNTTPGTDLQTREAYNTALALSMPEADVVSIELPGSNPADQNQLNDAVARITDSPATHRLGRFYISGYNGSGNPNLSLSFTGLLTTKVFTYEPTPSFVSSAVDVSAASLPVEWLSFTADKLDEQSVELNWITGSEINNDFFVVEKRLENETFAPIGKVDGAGYSNVSRDYSFEDRTPMAAVVYYRLQQVDFDGTADFSDVVEVHFDGLGLARYATYPNPAEGWFTLEAISEREQAHQYELLDLRGRTVLTGTLEANQGQTRIDVANIATGTYLLQVKNAKGQPINLKVTVK